MKDQSSVVVTGAAGFLGSHLCERLLNEGYNVVAVDNFCTGLESNKFFLEEIAKQKPSSSFLFFTEDVTLSWQWMSEVPEAWLKNLKYVFHFASPASPPHFQRLNIETIWVNTLGLEHAIKAANKHAAKVVFASTSEIYGDPQIHPQPEAYWGNVNSTGVRSCYNEAKRLGESLISNYNLNDGTHHGFVRIFNTYGPRMDLNDGRVIVNFCKDAISEGVIRVYGDGQQTRSFCYVDDLIEGILLYAKKDIHEPVNLGSEEEVSILALAKKIQNSFLGQKIEIAHQALPVDDPKKRRPDLQKAKSLLGWQAKVSLDIGLNKMISWMQTLNISSRG